MGTSEHVQCRVIVAEQVKFRWLTISQKSSDENPRIIYNIMSTYRKITPRIKLESDGNGKRWMVRSQLFAWLQKNEKVN